MVCASPPPKPEPFPIPVSQLRICLSHGYIQMSKRAKDRKLFWKVKGCQWKFIRSESVKCENFKKINSLYVR